MSAEDKKRIIIEAKGEVEYSKVTSALQLLGSKFFGEVQSGGVKVAGRTKTYDVNLVDESEQDVEDHDESIFVSMETSEDQALEVLMAEGDEDALTVQQFEDTIIESRAILRSHHVSMPTLMLGEGCLTKLVAVDSGTRDAIHVLPHDRLRNQFSSGIHM